MGLGSRPDSSLVRSSAAQSDLPQGAAYGGAPRPNSYRPPERFMVTKRDCPMVPGYYASACNAFALCAAKIGAPNCAARQLRRRARAMLGSLPKSPY